MVFMSHRCAEQCEEAVAGGLGDVAAIPLNRVNHQPQRRIDDCSRLFGVQILHQVHGAFDVGE
jgi:hypothetical protein